MNIVTAGIIAGLSLVGAWLGSVLSAYFSEKGKNLATKEDVALITEKIEGIKAQFSRKNLKTKAYIEKQIEAYIEVSNLAYKIRSEFFSHNTRLKSTPDLNTALKEEIQNYATEIIHTVERHQIFLSKEVDTLLTKLVEELIKNYKPPTDPKINDAVYRAWDPILDTIEEIRKTIKTELYSD